MSTARAAAFAEHGGKANDFYKLDPLLFSPAQVTVTNIKSGHSFTGGGLHEDLLEQSFGA